MLSLNGAITQFADTKVKLILANKPLKIQSRFERLPHYHKDTIKFVSFYPFPIYRFSEKLIKKYDKQE